MTKPFRDLKLAKKEGKTLTPEDLSSKDLGTSLLENMVPDAEFRAIVEKSIQDAIRVGTEIGKLLDDRLQARARGFRPGANAASTDQT